MPYDRRPELYAAQPIDPTPGPSLVAILFVFATLFLALSGKCLRAQSPDFASLHLHSAPLPAASSAAGARRGQVSRPRPTVFLELESLDTGVIRQLGLRGDLTLQQLAPGAYRLASVNPHVAAAAAATVVLHAGSELQLDVDPLSGQIKLGGLPPGLSPEQLGAAAQGNDRLDNQTDSRPAPGTPGIGPDQDGDGLPSAHGLPEQLNTTLIDGVSATDRFNAAPAGSGTDPAPDPDTDSDSAENTTGPAHGLSAGRHAGVSYLFSQSATREFRVQSAGYSAQTSNAGGAEVNRVSRSGTRTLHGEGFFVLRSSALAATDPDAFASSYANGVVTGAPVKPHDLRERFGVSVSGPVSAIPLRRVFFLAVYDGQRRGFPAICSPTDPNFFALTDSQSALLANRGVSSRAIDAGLTYLSSLTGRVDRRSDQDLVFARLDWLQHPAFAPGLQANLVRWNAPAALQQAPVVARGRASIGNATGALAALLLRVDSAFTARTSNSIRLQFLHDVQYETPQTRLPQESGVGPGGLAPAVNIGPNGLLFGTPPTLASGAQPDERRVELTEALSLVRGRHSLALGGSLSHIHDQADTAENAAGSFRYDSATPSGSPAGIGDFITDYTFNVNTSPNGGCPSIFSAVHLFCFQSFTQSFGQSSTIFSTTDFAVFAEDTWRPRPGLSLHAGLRYEYTLLPTPVAPNPALDAIFDLPGGTLGGQGATSIFPEDRNNFGPRLSLTYEPLGAGRGTIRAGYGLFFGRLPGATLRAPLTETALPSSVSRLRLTPATEVPCSASSSQGFGYPCSLAAEPAGAAASQTASAVVFDRRFRLPAIQQGSFALERRFGPATLSATYLVNLDRQLPSSTDLNIAASTSSTTFQLQGGTGAAGVRNGETFTLPVYTARVSPSFGPVTDLLSHSNGVYHGLLLTADARESHGFAFHADGAWSKAIDDAPDLSATPRTDSQLDPRANGYDKGLSSLNYPWIVHGRLLWQPRVRTGSRSLRRVANGWQLASMINARSGRPYSLNSSGGTSLAGGHISLNGSGGALYLPTVGRNTLRLPATSTADLRLQRAIPFGRLHVQASAEAFNVSNRRNISSVNARAYLRGTPVNGFTPLVFQSASAIAAEGLNTTPFGTPTASATNEARARQVQFELRVAF